MTSVMKGGIVILSRTLMAKRSLVAGAWQTVHQCWIENIHVQLCLNGAL
jgi:hypothetical protein